MNRPKGKNIEGLILVGEENRRLWRKGGETSVYHLSHGNLPDVDFFAAQHYIHVMEEGPEEIIFGSP